MEEALKPYRVNTHTAHLIPQLIVNNLAEVQADLSLLIKNESIKMLINEDVIFDSHLRNPVGFWSILLLEGYLKITERKQNHFDGDIYTLLFTHEEIRQVM